RLSKKPGKVKE
nr:RecName: Full=Histone H1.A2 [Gallus gallus]